MLGPAVHAGLEEGAVDDQLAAALEHVEQAQLAPGPLEDVRLLHRHPRHPPTFGGHRVTGAGQGLLLHEEPLPRRLPLLRRHDRRRVRRELAASLLVPLHVRLLLAALCPPDFVFVPVGPTRDRALRRRSHESGKPAGSSDGSDKCGGIPIGGRCFNVPRGFPGKETRPRKESEPAQEGQSKRAMSSRRSRSGSATTSMVAILPPRISNSIAIDNRPRAATTTPTFPSMRASATGTERARREPASAP